jgi:ATP-dependent helicase/nuclease subunit B
MSRVLSSLTGQLGEYSASASDISFASSAVHCAEEFSAYNISADDMASAINGLEDMNPSLCAKLKDMSLISAAYRAELKNTYGTDGENLEMLSKVLEKNNFFSDSVVVIDSFYGFTPQELLVIKHILRQAREVHITFCTEKDDTDKVFERAYENEEKIQETEN